MREPVRSHVVVIDAADGHVVADRPAPAAIDFTTAARSGRARRARARTATPRLTAQDLLTGDHAWTFVAPRPDISPAGDVAGFRLFRLGDRVGVQEAGRQVTLLSAGGDRRAARAPRCSTVRRSSSAPSGSSCSSGFADGRPGDARSCVPAGPTSPVPGYLLARSVDDGSLGDVEITYGSTVQAWDASTGERLWEADVRSGDRRWSCAGTVFCLSGASAGSVLAFDGRTGALLWSVSAGSYDQAQTLLTDGTSLVVADSPAPGERRGHARRLHARHRLRPGGRAPRPCSAPWPCEGTCSSRPSVTRRSCCGRRAS